MNSDAASLFILAVILLLIIVIFVRLASRIRRNGGSFTTNVFAATYEFYDGDKRNAIEVICEQKAGKKTREQFSDNPLE